MKRIGGLVVVVMACGLAACGGANAHGSKDAKVATGSGSTQGGAACKAPSSAEPLTRNAATSSSVVLAKVGAKHVAFVADEDAKSILTVDIESQNPSQIAETRLDGTPGQLWIAADGRVFATLRDKSELVVLSASRADAPLSRLCSVQTSPEPVSIAATPDESTIVVASGWGRRLSGFDASTLATKFEAELPREPRSVVVADDGKSAFVSHAVGSMLSVVDLANTKHETRAVPMRGYDANTINALKQQQTMLEQLRVSQAANPRIKQSEMLSAMEKQVKKLSEGRQSCQGFVLAKSTAAAPGRIFAPEVLVDAGSFDERPDGYGSDQTSTEIPAVAVIDEGSEKPLEASITIGQDQRRLFGRRSTNTREEHPECLLPRAATVDTKTKSLLVTCFGIDAVVAYDATAANPFAAERRRWTVGSGPNGVAVDSSTHRAVVWSQFDRTLSTFDIGDDALVDDKNLPASLKVQKVAMAPLSQKLPAEYALGRILFHATGDARIAADGRACASCHPDGRDDAITWATPEGPRRSIMLAGRAARTAPYSWNGNEMTLTNHLGNTFDRLSGKGLRSIELDSLVTYISEMPAPPPLTRVVDANEKVKVDRGRAIFTSAEAQCSSCHAGADFTDGKNHEVGSKHKADRAGSFNTPSLHLVGGTGPYFHDGRYATLSELLTKSDGTMGRTKQLTNTDLDALETFLRTL